MPLEIAVNPKTGEKVVLVNNEWKPITDTAVNSSGRKAYLVNNEWLYDDKSFLGFSPSVFAASASSLIGIAITWAIVRYVLPQRYAQSRKVDRSANVMYIAGWMLSIAISVSIGNMANEIIFSNVMGYEINQNNIYKSLIGVVIWPLLIYAIGYVIAKIISSLGKPNRAGVIRTAAAPDASAKGLAEQLTQLNELYKQGALSKEQFEAAKVKLLG